MLRRCAVWLLSVLWCSGSHSIGRRARPGGGQNYRSSRLEARRVARSYSGSQLGSSRSYSSPSSSGYSSELVEGRSLLTPEAYGKCSGIVWLR